MRAGGPLPSVLLIRLSSLGDVAIALPIAAGLVARGHQVGWLVEERCASLLEQLAFPLQVHVWRRGLLGRFALRGLGAQYDLVCDLQGNAKSGFVASGLGADCIIGLGAGDVRERSNLLFSDERAPNCEDPHVLARSLGVVAHALGEKLGAADLPLPPFLKAREAEVARLRRLLAPEAKYALVLGQPGDPRRIPGPLLEDLAQALGPAAFLLAGPGERSLHVPAGIPCLRQGGDIAELVAVGALLRQRQGRALGHDSGALHVLRATGVDTRFVFGPQDPARTGPFAEDVLVADMELECRPCLRRHCEHPRGPVCMSELRFEQLFAALRGS
ncbi:MAG: hypothetical protein CSA62_03815 [Planctomycetota bacterium]|nr:MAG: hypothetical protein CSA62_03815 [Planctomycetota bacterium]